MENFEHRIAYRVERGAGVLDRTVPGWENNVNLNTLNIIEGDMCVLAQVMGMHYATALRHFDTQAYEDVNPDTAWKYAFNHNMPNAQGAWAPADEVTAEWKRVILARRYPVSPSVTLTVDQLTELVTRAMDTAPTRGDWSELGLTVTYLRELDLLP